jgi:ABC-type transport system involved in multi-copper enzyme maturation permease subunit
MRATFAIALNAYREAVRDRVLFGVVGVAIASLLFGLSLAWLSLTEQIRILVDHGLVTMSLLANVVAIFLGASFLYKELELRTLYVILSKPLARWQFVLGKYLGIVATAVVFNLVTGALLLVLLDLQTAEARGTQGAGVAALTRQLAASRAARAAILVGLALFAALLFAASRRSARVRATLQSATGAVGLLAALLAFAASAWLARQVSPVETRYIVYATVLTTAEVCITAAVAMVFSSFSTPFVTGLLTFGVFMVGRSAGAMMELRARQLPEAIRALLRQVATVVPNLHVYVASRSGLLPQERDVSMATFLGESVAYAALYASILLVIAALLFRRRDLT